MSDKSKKFEPSMGWIVSVQASALAIIRVSEALDMDPVTLGQGLEKAGYKLEADPYDLSADSWKVIRLEQEKEKNGANLSVVPEEEKPNDENA